MPMNPIAISAYPCPIRILVADADPDTRSLYADLLMMAGCEVIEAFDGRDALVKAFSQSPALVITETRLPMLDGYGLCDVLRNDAATRSIPILVVTSETRLQMLERARMAGVDAILHKPVTPDMLVDEIRRLLEQAQRAPTSANLPSPLVEPARKRRSLVKAHLQMRTTTPPTQPPPLICPECQRALKYEHSHIGGVSHRQAEQWDTYVCKTCGGFEYRQRTRKLRQLA
jgi:CheY-like chemotaxis protein